MTQKKTKGTADINDYLTHTRKLMNMKIEKAGATSPLATNSLRMNQARVELLNFYTYLDLKILNLEIATHQAI